MAYKDILKQRAKKNNSPKLLETFSVYDIIKYPITSEKSVNQSTNTNAYHFVVDKRANKNDVRVAIKTLYNVVPSGVSTSILPHKWRMNRKTVRNPLKKAIVTLKKWETISFSV